MSFREDWLRHSSVSCSRPVRRGSRPSRRRRRSNWYRWDEVRLLGDTSLAGAIASLEEAGVEPPTIGFELSDGVGSIVEWSWPLHHVAVTIDADSARDAWLEEAGWIIVDAQAGFPEAELIQHISLAVHDRISRRYR